MTRDPSCKFRNFQLWCNSALNNRKSHKISGGKRTLLKKLSAKNLTGAFMANYFYDEITQSHNNNTRTAHYLCRRN